MAYEYPYATSYDVIPFAIGQGTIQPNTTAFTYATAPTLNQVTAFIRNAASLIVHRLRAAGYVHPFAPYGDDVDVDEATQDFITFLIATAANAQISPIHTIGERGVRQNAGWITTHKLLDDVTEGRIALRMAYRKGTVAERALTEIGVPLLGTGANFNAMGLHEYALWRQHVAVYGWI